MRSRREAHIRASPSDMTEGVVFTGVNVMRSMKEAAVGTVTCGAGTAADPWVLQTPPQTSEFQAWRDEAQTPPALVVQVGTTRLSYALRGIDDAVAMLKARRDWVAIGNSDEGKPVAEGSLEAWARDTANPVGGYYGLRKGYRGRFGN
jgi:hypothetical protein